MTSERRQSAVFESIRVGRYASSRGNRTATEIITITELGQPTRQVKAVAMITASDTFAMTRYAQQLVDGDAPSFISCSVSSAVMTTVVRDGKIRGAFHWMGLVHGILDPEVLRKIDAGDVEPGNVSMKAGMLPRRGKTFADTKGIPSKEILERVCDAVQHNVYGLVPFAGNQDELDAVVSSGRFTDITSPVAVREQLSEEFSTLVQPSFCRKYSTAIGAALIARDTAMGQKQDLGVPIEYQT